MHGKISLPRLLVIAVLYCIIGFLLMASWPGIARAADVKSKTLVGVIDQDDGGEVRLYAEAGERCVDNGYAAEYWHPLDKGALHGCWTMQPQGWLSAAFLDGDYMMVPFSKVKHPTKLGS